MKLLTLSALASAVLLAVSPASAGDMKHDMKSGDAMEIHSGDLVLAGAFARATLPNQPVGGAFLTITNNGTSDDTLIGVSATFAERSEVHEMKMVGDTMKMRKMADGLLIPAGETVTLEPGGYHLMFMQLNQPLIEGEAVDVTLEFQQAGTVTLPIEIRGKAAKHGNHDHSGHGS